MSINKRNTLSEYFIKSNYSLFCFLLLFINLCIISDNRVFADDIYIKTDSSNVELFGKRPVLIVQHKKDQSASVATSVVYVFVAGKFIYEMKFSVNVGNEKESGEILKRNLPLFEKIVEENKMERAN
ncbi:MAG: hypothetical protein II961_07120 [Candidatus Riflebacteria bacterium]|nr:hypothetical protein [Candidatus Riflebacteria bacterium]